MLSGAICFIVAYLLKYAGTKDIESLESRICIELDKQGFQYKKHEGTLYVMNNGNSFHIHLWDTSNERIKQLYFVYDFEDEKQKNISLDGWLRATNRINVDNPHITFITHDESFRCRYETAISNAKDFLPEFDTAYKIIGEAVDEFNRIYPYLERDYPNIQSEKKSNIGFK